MCFTLRPHIFPRCFPGSGWTLSQKQLLIRSINFNNDDKYELEPSSDSRPEPLTCISLGYQSEVEAIAQNARLNFVLTNGGRTARWHDRTGKTATARSPVTGLRMNFMLSLEHLSTVSSLVTRLNSARCEYVAAGGQMEHFQPHARVSCACAFVRNGQQSCAARIVTG